MHSVNANGVTVDLSVSAVRVPSGARVVSPVTVRFTFVQAAFATSWL